MFCVKDMVEIVLQISRISHVSCLYCLYCEYVWCWLKVVAYALKGNVHRCRYTIHTKCLCLICMQEQRDESKDSHYQLHWYHHRYNGAYHNYQHESIEWRLVKTKPCDCITDTISNTTCNKEMRCDEDTEILFVFSNVHYLWFAQSPLHLITAKL